MKHTLFLLALSLLTVAQIASAAVFGGVPLTPDTVISLAARDKPCVTGVQLRLSVRLLKWRRNSVPCDPFATPFYKGFRPGGYSSSSSSSSSSSFPSSSSSSPSSGSIPGATYDFGDTTIRQQFLLLGEMSPVIGANKIYMEDEALNVTKFVVNLPSAPSIQSLSIYDDDKRYLGRASQTSAGVYELSLPIGTLRVPRREERGVYYRAQLSMRDAGGDSAESVQIGTVNIEGYGEWSNRKYTKQSSASDEFPEFTTARSTITKVTNAGAVNGALVTGTNQLLGTYRFEGRKTDSSAHIDLQTLQFQIEQTGGISLSTITLRTAGFSDTIACTNSSTIVTCANIPENFGALGDAPRTLLLYGNIAPTSAVSASLRLSLTQAGDPWTDGSITWTDGTDSFTWVGLDDPVVSGTYWSY